MKVENRTRRLVKRKKLCASESFVRGKKDIFTATCTKMRRYDNILSFLERLNLWAVFVGEFMQKQEINAEIDRIVNQIIQKYKPLKIIIFGSAARGEFDKVNDLDFLIIKEKVPLYGIDRMCELDELIDRKVAADMLVYRPHEFEERIKLRDPSITTILKEGRILYG